MPPAKDRILCCDVDNVLCQSQDESIPYYERVPYQHAVVRLRRLREAGYYLRLQTARGMDRFQGDLAAVEAYHRPRLEDWLQKWAVPYDELAFGKVVAIRYIDDLAFRVESEKGEEDWDRLFADLGLPTA